MSRKHHTKHHRSRSRYKSRLAARGLSRTPVMPDFINCGKGPRASSRRAEEEAA